jgi:hypothetical protein
VYTAYKDSGLVVVEIAIPGSDSTLVQAFHDVYEIPYPVMIDNIGVTDAYEVITTPTIFLISREGIISYAMSGFQSAEMLEFEILPLLFPERFPDE